MVGVPLLFWGLKDDNTTRTVSTSSDGQSWVQAHSVGRTAVCTPNQSGLAVNGEDRIAGMTLVHRSTTTP